MVDGDGYYFDGDYPEVYDESLEELQNLLRRQLTELEKKCPTQDAATIGFLRGRRSSRRDLVQIEIAHLDAPRVLVASREVLFGIAEGRRAVPNGARRAGFDDRAGGCGRFVRLVNNRTRPDKIAKGITEQGLPNTLALTASVGKGIGGPDAVANPLPKGSKNFPAYRRSATWAAAGSGPKVAIIDTGIPGDHEDGLPTMIRTDGWLRDVPRSGDNRDLLDQLPGRDGYLDYQAGHGTFVAGIVQRVAPAAEVRVYRAADSDGFADDIAIADALRWAVEDGAQIINVSLGMVTTGDVPPPALEKAVDELTADGNVVIVAAAGNFGDDTKCWPAAFEKVVGVGALIQSEEVGNDVVPERSGMFEPAPWSSKGGHINFWTVAEGVRSTFVTGCESPLFDNEPAIFPKNAWAMWSGTSFAAPQIAGAIARVMQEQNRKPRDAVTFLGDQGARVQGQPGKALRVLTGIRVEPRVLEDSAGEHPACPGDLG
jgi:hypothetical protein